jgi:hypothetical protein
MAVPLALLALAAVAVGAGLLLGRLEVGGRFGLRVPSAQGDGQGGTGPLRIVEARDHDPGGDNAEEHPEAVHLAIDGDPATFWETEGYNSADLGGTKSGVGLILDLGDPQRIRRVAVRTTLPGWRFEIHGSDDGESFSAPFASVGGKRRFVAEQGRTVVRLEEQQYRYVRIWVTRLAPDGSRFRATIAEVEVAGGG